VTVPHNERCFGLLLDIRLSAPTTSLFFCTAMQRCFLKRFPRCCTRDNRDTTIEATLGSRDPQLARRNGFTQAGVTRPAWKAWADRGLAGYLNVTFGLSVTTYFDGYRARRKRIIAWLSLTELAENHFLDIEFIDWAGAAIRHVEVPISNVEHHSVRAYSSIKLLRDMLLLGMRRRRVRGWRQQ
jgi:hypothetical protein